MTSIPFKIIKLDDKGEQPIVNCTINNIPSLMVIDTGASRSIISSSFVNSLNIENQNSRHLPNAKASGIGNDLSESFKAVIPNINFQNHHIDNFEMIVIDIEHINKIFDYLNYERINGLLGCDIINFLKLKIDYNNLEFYDIISQDGDACQLIANCNIAGKQMRFILDTGASRSVIDLKTLNDLPFNIEKEINSSKIAGLNSSMPFINEFIADQISFGDYIIDSQQFLSMDIDNINEHYQTMKLSAIDGLLGGDICSKHSVLIDFDSQHLIFQ